MTISLDDLPRLLRAVEAAQREHDQLVGEQRALLKSLKDQFGCADEKAGATLLEKERAKELAELKAYNKEFEKVDEEYGGKE